MLKLKNTSIRQRLTLIIMGISCVTVLVTTLTISIIGVYSLRANIVSELDISATIVGDRNRAALSFGKQEQAISNLSILGVKPPIVQACLYDSEGKEFAAYINPKYRGSAICPTTLDPRAIVTGERIELMKTIDGDFGVTGYIYLESTLEQIDQYIEKQSTIALTVALGAFLLSYLLAVNLQKAISQPLLHLASVARHVTEHKDYSVRAKQQGDPRQENKNELTILTHSFNNMLSEIGARNKQLQEQNVELERSRDLAESSNRAKSQFLANISHELRTPLNAIIGFSSILMNQLFGALGDPKYLEYAKDINDSGTHLLDIINDILDLSKAEAGKLALAFEEMHVAKAIQKCVTIMTERAEKGEVRLITNVPKSLPSLVVDRLRFIQILLNVLSNAVKFTNPGGTVDISVSTKETDSVVTHFVITIKDTGIGMTQEDIDKAFQSFGQVDSGLNRKYEGTGLGLPLTKKLIELHHGDITIESELGHGTSVALIFPAMPPEGYVQEQDAL
ncbi:MAG: ATP-binding protein [Alphaproteobacteria bacterium]|nr:ATP-binding protein [Alphaproteobacteria bacterium]